MADHVDVLIAGGGPVGAVLALLAKAGGHDLLLVDAAAPGRPDDPRTIALSWGSRLILEAAGVWDDGLPATPIETVHVSQQGGFGRAVLERGEMGVPALGYIVRHADLTRRVQAVLREAGVPVLSGTAVRRVRPSPGFALVELADAGRSMVTARLAVIADGGDGLAGDVPREVHDYRQAGLIGFVKPDRPHGHVAWERFTPNGPLALLPCGDEFALVLTDAPERVDALLRAPEADLLAHLQALIGDRAGRFIGARDLASWPLRRTVAAPTTAGHRVLIGNAAQTLHPVAGQGLNLGLRDARDLAVLLNETPRAEIGGASMLRRYAALRRRDRARTVAATHGLVALFAGDQPLVRAGRGLGLAATELLPPLRAALARRMMMGTFN